VKSTRTRWEEFRKKWKKDRRFFGWGRDDREREKVFKVHLKELGERKRKDVERAEKEFFDLLESSREIKRDSVWKEVSPSLPIYDTMRTLADSAPLSLFGPGEAILGT
jgi:transcription elongation regulator 1